MFLFSKTNKSNGRLLNKDDLTSEGYFILDHIANGSYGEVRHAKYVYEEKELNMVVKIIDTQKTSKDYVSKFLPRELDIIRKINHPYIIHVHSILQKRAVLFLFMEYAEKGELLEYILNKGPLKENLARIWFRQMVLALQYLHTMDIVHRDIKCENILLNEHYKIKLTDFGFSKFIKRGKRLNCGTFCCSLCYASPELLNYQNSREYDGKASDIWSLGVVLYVMLNKKIPFSKNNIQIMYKEQVKRYWEHQPAIDKVISDNVKICVINLLQPEPRKRWTIDKVLACDWIKMNKKLAILNRQESIAFVEALKSDKAEHHTQLKNIEANISNTQRILNERPQQFLSTESEDPDFNLNSLELDDDSNTSRYKLRRSQRIMDASNLLQQNYKNDVKHDLTTDNDLKRDLNIKKKNSKRDSNAQNRNSKTDLNGSQNKLKPDSNS